MYACEKLRQRKSVLGGLMADAVQDDSSKRMRKGKDKDIYDYGNVLLIIATDRISAFGKSLETEVKDKGRITNLLSAYWFRKLRSLCPNHMISIDKASFPDSIRTIAEAYEDRAMLVWKTTPLPIRCVVRGYLAGAGWREYREAGEICGNKLPVGMVESQRLPAPLFAPTVKGRTDGRNENIDYRSLQQLLGNTLAEQLRDISLRLYFNAWRTARERGVLIADTKFEFGLHDGKLMLIDECLTPDTSRLWPIESYRRGGTTPSMDKQLLIDYLDTLNDSGTIPCLPDGMLMRLGDNYQEAYRRMVGRRFYLMKECTQL